MLTCTTQCSMTDRVTMTGSLTFEAMPLHTTLEPFSSRSGSYIDVLSGDKVSCREGCTCKDEGE